MKRRPHSFKERKRKRLEKGIKQEQLMKKKTAANNVYRLFNATLLDLVFHYIKKPVLDLNH